MNNFENDTELQQAPAWLQGGKDRRVAQRYCVELECEERSLDGRYFRITSDLSAFGLATRQGFATKRGHRVSLTLRLPDDPINPVQVEAEVVGRYDESGGMRLAFRKPSVDAIRRIHRFLKNRTSDGELDS